MEIPVLTAHLLVDLAQTRIRRPELSPDREASGLTARLNGTWLPLAPGTLSFHLVSPRALEPARIAPRAQPGQIDKRQKGQRTDCPAEPLLQTNRLLYRSLHKK